MKVPSLRLRTLFARHRGPRSPFDARAAGAMTTAGGVSNSAKPAPDTGAVSDARGTAGLIVDHAFHAEGCSCLRRRTEQSGEVQSHGAPRAGETPLAPARPLTGFFSRPGYVPPTVIVSDLLNIGAEIDVMLLELDGPAPAPAPAPARAPTKTLCGPPTDEIAAAITAAVAATEPARPRFQPPARVHFDPPPRRQQPPPKDDDILTALEDFGFEP
jgi:hypothetical protein